MNIFLVLLEIIITYFLAMRAKNPGAKQQFMIALIAPVAVFGILIMPLIIFSTKTTSQVITGQLVTFLFGFALCYATVLFVTER